MKALILAGGQGKRLRPLTQTIPKPLIEINNKPIIQYQIEWLKKHGINEIILAVGYLKEKFIEKIGSGKKLGVKIAYVIEEYPLGTGGAIKNAEHVLRNEDRFLVMNGDIITNFNLSQMIQQTNGNVIAVTKMKSQYGIIKLENNKIIEFIEKPTLDFYINAGIYLFESYIFEYLPEKGDIEKITFPKLANEGKLFAYEISGFWKSIDTLKDKEEVEKLIKENPKLFL